MSGVGERELAKILFGDEALHHLERFGYDICKIGNVKVREVGAEHRPGSRLGSLGSPLGSRLYF